MSRKRTLVGEATIGLPRDALTTPARFEVGITTFAEITRDPMTGRLPTAEERMRDTIEQAEVAEQVGLDVFGIGEHHRGDFIASSPPMMLAAVAARTQTIRVISSVTVLSSLDPVRVFEDFATLDLISGGRAEIIAGRGSYTDSFPLFGYDLADYEALFDEKLELLVAIRNHNPISWTGRLRPPLRNADIAPRPVQAELPIWVGVGGTPSSGTRAGRLGLPLTYGVLLGAIDAAVPVRDAYRRAAVESGHDLRGLRTAIAGHGYVAHTSQEARELMYRHFSHGFIENGRDPGRGFHLTRPAFDAMSSPIGALMVGSPHEMVEKLLAQHEIYGHSRVLVQFGMGGVPQNEHLKAIELFGTEVARVLRTEIAARTGATLAADGPAATGTRPSEGSDAGPRA
jgi:probable LLM family oxidoreductase